MRNKKPNIITNIHVYVCNYQELTNAFYSFIKLSDYLAVPFIQAGIARRMPPELRSRAERGMAAR